MTKRKSNSGTESSPGVAQSGRALALGARNQEIGSFPLLCLLKRKGGKMNLEFSEGKIRSIFASSLSKSDVARKLGLEVNSKSIRFVNSLIEKFNINIENLDPIKSASQKNKKYKRVKKTCPVCLKAFETRKGHIREKKVCSRSCSNTYFRSGKNNPNYKHDKKKWGYRRICFSHWKKECVICGFDCVVEVHHLDENKENNAVENLIPLCPNHHRMIHTKKHGVKTKKLLLEAISKQSVG